MRMLEAPGEGGLGIDAADDGVAAPELGEEAGAEGVEGRFLKREQEEDHYKTLRKNKRGAEENLRAPWDVVGLTRS